MLNYFGYIYSFEGSDDWAPGDIAALIMGDNGTPENIKDDTINAVRYAGYID